ncbi:MAG: T9SS type A sorting domain-containing protein [Candidatus Latescibacterota bacterium]
MMRSRNALGCTLIFGCFLFTSPCSSLVTVKISDSSGAPVSSALVTFANAADTQKITSSTTDASGLCTINITVGVKTITPVPFSLGQNFPNPFNPSTVIDFAIPISGETKLTIYNILGQSIRTLVNGYFSQGAHTVVWDGRDDSGKGVGAGVYLYRLKSGGHAETKKMLLLDGYQQTGSFSSVSSMNKAGNINSVMKIASTMCKVTITGGGIVDYAQASLAVTDGETYNFTVTRLTERQAYQAIIDFAIAKQIMMYDILEIESSSYTTGLFENELTYAQIDSLFSTIYGLSTYKASTDNAEAALAYIQSKTTAKAANVMKTAGLVSSMKGFWTYLSGSGERNRNRILTVASNMAEPDRSKLFEDLRPEWKEKVQNENDFWQKLEKGDFDNQAPQIFNDWVHTADSDFGTMAEEKGLTIQKIVVREGAEGVKAGAELMVDVTKAAVPSLGKGIDLAKKALEYSNRAETIFKDPVKGIKDETKIAIANKIGSYVDVDGAVAGGAISETASTAIKAVSDFTFGTTDPSKIAKMGIDWGIAQIKNALTADKKSDIAIAQSSSAGVVPSNVIAVGQSTEDIMIFLPPSVWDVIALLTSGESNKTASINITAGGTIEITIEDAPSFAKTIELQLPESNYVLTPGIRARNPLTVSATGKFSGPDGLLAASTIATDSWGGNAKIDIQAYAPMNEGLNLTLNTTYSLSEGDSWTTSLSEGDYGSATSSVTRLSGVRYAISSQRGGESLVSSTQNGTNLNIVISPATKTSYYYRADVRLEWDYNTTYYNAKGEVEGTAKGTTGVIILHIYMSIR